MQESQRAQNNKSMLDQSLQKTKQPNPTQTNKKKNFQGFFLASFPKRSWLAAWNMSHCTWAEITEDRHPLLCCNEKKVKLPS